MVTIQLIQPRQQQAAKQVILTVCGELWGVSEEIVLGLDPLSDLDDVEDSYFKQNGVFFVLVDGERVVGTGGVRHWQGNICELKRLWFLKDYRGRGLGKLMTERILDFATAKGYQRIRLDVADAEVQVQAIKLYQQCGFYFIDRYNDGPCSVFMEKILEEDASTFAPPLKQAA